MRMIDAIFRVPRKRLMTAPWTKEELIDFVEDHGATNVRITLAVGGEDFVIRAKVPSSFKEVDGVENFLDLNEAQS
jgi:hypothetical protein